MGRGVTSMGKNSQGRASRGGQISFRREESIPRAEVGLTVTTTGIHTGLAKASVESVFMDHINLSPYIKQRLRKVLNPAPPKVPS